MRLHENPAFITRVDEWKLRGKPEQNGMDWNVEKWQAEFPEHGDFLRKLSLQNLGNLDRKLVRETVANEISIGNFETSFLAVMIWGFGSDARGPFRTRRIIEQKKTGICLENCLAALQKNDIDSAYKALIDNGPKYLGPAFGTKYIYFAAGSIESNQPVILDSLVSIGLKEWGDITFNPLNAKSHDYLRYLDYINDEADHFSITPENLEMILFTETARLKGNQSWANRQSYAQIGENEKLIWGLLFAAELMLRLPELQLTYTQPGGGQYECLTLTAPNSKFPYEFDLNLVGSIHVNGVNSLHIEWQDLIQRGAVSSAELLINAAGLNTEVNLSTTSIQARALRALAETAIRNFESHNLIIEPIVSDNSVYGKLIRYVLLEPYFENPMQRKDIDASFGKQLDYMWSISIDSEPSRLINLQDGTAIRRDGTVLGLSWP